MSDPVVAPTPAVELVRLGPDDWEAHRDLRLESLADSPEMFGSSYDESRVLDEPAWRARLEAVTYWQARSAGMPLGMVGLWEVPDDSSTEASEAAYESVPFLISMYVRPAARGRGVGEALVRAVLDEARRRGHDRVVLDVTSSNRHARALYERTGFMLTGDSYPHPRQSTLCEHTMVCDLAGSPT